MTRSALLSCAAALCAALACSGGPDAADVAAAGDAFQSGEVLSQVMRLLPAEPTGLVLEGDELRYCEGETSRAFGLANGRRSSPPRDCPAAAPAPDPTCQKLGGGIRVRPSAIEGIDAVDVAGRSFVVAGRVRDCAVDGDLLAIVTERAVELIDTRRGHVSRMRDEGGGDRVVVGAGWIAWTEASVVNATRIDSGTSRR